MGVRSNLLRFCAYRFNYNYNNSQKNNWLIEGITLRSYATLDDQLFSLMIVLQEKILALDMALQNVQ